MSIKTRSSPRKALLLAITANRAKDFRRILKRKGWPKESLWSDYELLVQALRLGRKRIVHVLLDHDARVRKTAHLHSPLHLAAEKVTRSWTKVIARLLSQGARVSDKNFRGDTALHIAFDCHSPDEAIGLMLQAHLLRCPNKADVANKDGLRFLHIACATSCLTVDKVMRFVDETNVNSQVCLECDKDYAGYTALHFAVKNIRHKVAELLIEQGANIDKGDCNGTTALHLALRLRDVRMIDLLLARDKSKANIIDKFGLSYFMVACAGSKQSVAKAYLAKLQSHIPLYDMISAQVENVENCTGYTPLHFAVDTRQIVNVQFLVDEGADCCAATNDGLTPHALAEQKGYEDISKMLMEHCQLVRMCMLMRSQEDDYNFWGDEYERCILNDRVKEIKQLRWTLIYYKSHMPNSSKSCSIKTIEIN